MESHGGYFVRLESFYGLDLVALARQALMLDGQPEGVTGLLVTVNPRRKLVRIAYDGPHTWGRAGAEWYGEHHALARLLSSRVRNVVHAYVFSGDRYEEVTAFGNGRKVGGERLVYSDVELPDDVEDLDDAAFERLRSRWPLGHLAYVIGITRLELLKMPQATGELLELGEAADDAEAVRARLNALLPHAHVRAAV